MRRLKRLRRRDEAVQVHGMEHGSVFLPPNPTKGRMFSQVIPRGGFSYFYEKRMVPFSARCLSRSFFNSRERINDK